MIKRWWASFDARDEIERLKDECHKHTDALDTAAKEINTLNTKLEFTKEALLETMRQLQLSVLREKGGKNDEKG